MIDYGTTIYTAMAAGHSLLIDLDSINLKMSNQSEKLKDMK